MKLPHHLSIQNGHLQINGQNRVIEQFESHKTALGVRYPKLQVLFAVNGTGAAE